MKKIFPILFLLLISAFLPNTVYGQLTLNRSEIDFTIDGDSLDLPQVGGLNTPQYNAIDLNNDGIQDLYIYDRRGEIGLTFLGNGTSYDFAPQYQDNFPSTLKHFVIIRDYNCDGIGDIFTYSTPPTSDNFEVHRGYYDTNNEIAFEEHQTNQSNNALSYPLNGFPLGIYGSRLDISDINDLDNDGDMDILAFDVIGGRVNYFENQSSELGFGCDSLIYENKSNCWGRFFESGIDNSLFTSPSIDSCWGLGFFVNGGRHSGSTLLTLDMDDDGDKEILIGDVSFPNMTMLYNGGNPDTAWMNAQDTFFPSYDVSIDIPIFPVAFHLDLDFDGHKDLLATTNANGNVAESKQVGWFYKNTTDDKNPQFALQQTDFLVEHMLDFGTGAQAAYWDYNGDGDLDMFVANYGYFDEVNGFTSQIAFLKNVGNATNPAFELEDANFAGIDQYNFRDVHITFGDINGDNKADIILGQEDGELYYLENTTTTGAPTYAPIVPNYQGIDVGSSSKPQLFDVDDDGLLDLIIGQQSGILSYYRNTGTATNPTFTLQTVNDPNNSFGGVDVRPIGSSTGYSAPFMTEINGSKKLYVGSKSGYIFQYNNIDNNVLNQFTLEADTFGGIYEGTYSTIDVRDLNGDNAMDYTIGNVRGGLALFSDDQLTTPVEQLPIAEQKVKLFPNPAKDYINIRLFNFEGETTLNIIDALGRVVQTDRLTDVQTKFTTAHLNTGIYFFQFVQNGKSTVERVVIQ